MRCLKVSALALLLVVICGPPIQAYLPGNCSPEHAASDYDKAGAVVIGRVVKIERVSEIERSKKHGDTVFFGYGATIRIGRVVRGPLKVGDEIVMFLGSYAQREEDNATPTYAATCNTHAPHALKFNGVYLLFMDQRNLPAKRQLKFKDYEIVPDQRALEIDKQNNMWEPRSCHFSVHEIFFRYDRDEHASRKTLRVRHGCWAGWNLGEYKPPAPLPLDEFLAMKKNQADEARKKAKAEKARSERGR